MRNFKALAALAAFFLVVGCTSKKLEYGLEGSETLRININTEPPSLDWQKSTDTTSSHITVNLMEGLAVYDLNNPELPVVPGLAESWTVSKDSKKWTFKIRKGVKWTDGVELTAQHFVDGWERLLSPATASEYAYHLYPIQGAQEFNQGKNKDFASVGAKATDAHTLVVDLKQAMSFFPMLTTHHSAYPVRKDVVAKFGDKWTEPGNIVTLGPYKLKIWEHDKALVLERNDDYYGEKAKTRYVLAYMINELSTALNLFESGKLDVLTELPSTELSKLKTRSEYRNRDSLLMYYYGFNIAKPPMNNPLVRKALATAIDREELVRVLNGGQKPLTSWVPGGIMGYTPDKGTKFDVTKAKELLKQAGFADPTKVPKIVIGFNTNENHQRIAENIQAQLKKNLGVTVELQNQEWKVYLKQLQADAPHIFRMGWMADYPDPSNFMDLMLSYSENNHTRWKNNKYDEMVGKARAEQNLESRKSLYAQAQALLVEDDVPVVPLYSGTLNKFVATRVQNYPLNALDRLEFRNVTLTK